MLRNWSYLITTFAPGQGGGASELISQAWKIGGEFLFWFYLALVGGLILAAILIPATKWVNVKIDSKQGEEKTLKSIGFKIIGYSLGCLAGAILIAVVFPVVFNMESSGGGITGGPYFSGLKSFF